MSGDDVYQLHRERLSIRVIAARPGLSRSKVHRTLTAEPDDDGGLVRLDERT